MATVASVTGNVVMRSATEWSNGCTRGVSVEIAANATRFGPIHNRL
jgi:hypothetical protein